MALPPNPPSIDDIRKQVYEMLDGLGNDPQIAATVVFQVRQDKIPEFDGMRKDLTAATLPREGCETFVFHRHNCSPWHTDPPDTETYLIYERWRSVGQFRGQWDSDELKRFQYAVGPMLAPGSFPDLNFYCDAPVTGGKHSSRVLRTGQEKCWDANGNVVTGDAARGQDGFFKAGVDWPRPRYTVNRGYTVTDGRTGLTWLKDADFFKHVTWAQALSKIEELNAGKHGLDDGLGGKWRLPNVNELQSILDLSQEEGPAVRDEQHVFDNLDTVNYWTASSVALVPPTPLGWYTAMAVGVPVFDLKPNRMHMWPVKGESRVVMRTGQTQCWDEWGKPISCAGSGQDGELQTGRPWPHHRFHDNHDGTVTDHLTRLTWLKHADAFPQGTMSWHDALRACNSLRAGSFPWLNDGSKEHDWRLPNLHELRSLVDYDRTIPALPEHHPFEGVRPSLYWSSTTVPSQPNQARFVFIGIGPSVWDHKSVLLGVWPVKGGVTKGKP